MGLVKEVGMPACWGDPRFDAATKRIAAACKASGVVAGYWNSDVKDKVDGGFRFLVVGGHRRRFPGLTSSLKEKQKGGSVRCGAIVSSGGLALSGPQLWGQPRAGASTSTDHTLHPSSDVPQCAHSTYLSTRL